MNVDTILPRGDSMTRGQADNHKRNNDGNPMGNVNVNPIIDSQQYEVQFEDREVTGVTANDISKTIYDVQCDRKETDMFYLIILLIFKRKRML